LVVITQICRDPVNQEPTSWLDFFSLLKQNAVVVSENEKSRAFLSAGIVTACVLWVQRPPRWIHGFGHISQRKTPTVTRCDDCVWLFAEEASASLV